MAVILGYALRFRFLLLRSSAIGANGAGSLSEKSPARDKRTSAFSARINSGTAHAYVPELPNALWQRPPRALAAILLNPIANTRRLGMAGEANSDPARCPCLFGGSENIRGNSRRYRLQGWTIAADGDRPVGDEDVGLKGESWRA